MLDSDLKLDPGACKFQHSPAPLRHWARMGGACRRLRLLGPPPHASRNASHAHRSNCVTRTPPSPSPCHASLAVLIALRALCGHKRRSGMAEALCGHKPELWPPNKRHPWPHAHISKAQLTTAMRRDRNFERRKTSACLWPTNPRRPFPLGLRPPEVTEGEWEGERRRIRCSLEQMWRPSGRRTQIREQVARGVCKACVRELQGDTTHKPFNRGACNYVGTYAY